MDVIDIIATVAGLMYISYEVYSFMYDRKVQLQAKIDAEIDRLHK